MQKPIRSNKHKAFKSGTRFGALKVLFDGPHIKYSNGACVHKTTCKCDCGMVVEIKTSDLVNRTSCRYCSHKKYGVAHPPNYISRRLYRIWVGMRFRCRSDKHEAHKYYKDKGIGIDKRWEDFSSFLKWSMKHGYKDNLQIDRINGNKGYSPENCRWVDSKIQQNNKSNIKKYLYNGKMRTLSEISSITGVDREKIWRRLHDGKKMEDAVKKHL